MVDQSHTKENEAKETIQRLKQEINNLSKLVEQGAGLTMGQEHRLFNSCLSIAYSFAGRHYLSGNVFVVSTYSLTAMPADQPFTSKAVENLYKMY